MKTLEEKAEKFNYNDLNERSREILLGFLNIYDSWYFIALALLLMVNLIAASVNLFPRTIKAVFGPYPSFKGVQEL